MQERLFSTSEVAELLGVTRQSVLGWIQDGNLDVARRGCGRGVSNLIGESTAFALFVGRTLKQQGLPLNQVAAAMTWISGKGLERLKKDFGQGRNHLLLFGTTPTRRLMTEEEVASKSISEFVKNVADDSTLSARVNVSVAHKFFADKVREIIGDRNPALMN